jgi:hypothetical protein
VIESFFLTFKDRYKAIFKDTFNNREPHCKKIQGGPKRNFSGGFVGRFEKIVTVKFRHPGRKLECNGSVVYF